jgi:hypothetical protein
VTVAAPGAMLCGMRGGVAPKRRSSGAARVRGWGSTVVWFALAAVALASAGAALVGLVVAVPGRAAWGQGDPPPVRGLAIGDAVKALTAWRKDVVVEYLPARENLPAGIDLSTVVVIGSAWLNPTAGDATAPRIQLTLGTAVPDLIGLTWARARDLLTAHGLAGLAVPDGAGPDLVVTSVQPPAGELVGVGGSVLVSVTATASATPTPPVAGPSPGPGSAGRRPAPVLVGVAAGAVVVLVVALVALGLGSWRRAGSRPAPAAAGQVEIRAYAGQMIGPRVSWPAGRADVSVRLVPVDDPGTVTLREGA